MQEEIIHVENLMKTYPIYAKSVDRMKEALSPFGKKYSRDFNALNNVSFTVYRGETVGIVGTNGSGKSTLLKIITGVLQPTSGNVVVNGRISALLELGTGFNMEYTGMENIYLHGSIMGYSRQEMEGKVPSILAFAGIGDFIDQPVKNYSSGMFARLAFAVAISIEPEILIVDEALSVGDIRFQLKCMNRMKEMMENSGTTVLFVSHDTNVIRRFCSRAIWLNRGRVIHCGEVNDTVDRYLDYLKLGDEALLDGHGFIEPKEDEIREFRPGDNIAEITGFRVLNQDTGQKATTVQYNTPIVVEVTYDVYDESIPDPVLGVALGSVDNDYVCGLNTLLDNVRLPWKYGRNTMRIEYPNGLLCMGGKFFFDAALMDRTASVNFFYRARISEIRVVTEYIAEGRYVIPHHWSVPKVQR